MKTTMAARVGVWFFTGFFITVTGFSLWHALSGLVWLVMHPATALHLLAGIGFLLLIMGTLSCVWVDVNERLK